MTLANTSRVRHWRVRSRRSATFTPSAHVRRHSLPVWPPTLNKIPLPLPLPLPTAYAYGCPALQRNGGAVAPRNLAAYRSQETPVQAGTRRARNQESEPPFRNCWQPEEKEMSVCTRRPSWPEGKRPRASKRQIAEQVSVLFLLKFEVGDLGDINSRKNFLFVEGTHES